MRALGGVAGVAAAGAALFIWLGRGEIADCERAGYSDCASDGILYFFAAITFALVGIAVVVGMLGLAIRRARARRDGE